MVRSLQLCVFAVAFGCLSNAQLQAESLANRMPSGALVYGELSGLEEVLNRIQNSDRLAALLSSDLYDQLASTPDITKALAGKALVEDQKIGRAHV